MPYIFKPVENAYAYGYTSLVQLLEERCTVRQNYALASTLWRQIYQTATSLINADYEVNGRFFEHRRTALHYAVQ